LAARKLAEVDVLRRQYPNTGEGMDKSVMNTLLKNANKLAVFQHLTSG